MNSKMVGFVVVTVGEVAGLVCWLFLTRADQPILGYLFLLAGEALEWALLAYMIANSPFSHPLKTGRIKPALIQTGLISLSESVLWVVWLLLIPLVGIVIATILLFVAMHIKHDGDMAIFRGRPFLRSALDISDLVATAFEVGGAAFWLTLTLSGYPVLGGVVLLVCISIEHLLQFRTAGFLQSTQPTKGF